MRSEKVTTVTIGELLTDFAEEIAEQVAGCIMDPPSARPPKITPALAEMLGKTLATTVPPEKFKKLVCGVLSYRILDRLARGPAERKP
jgi:hypothetical protein